MKIKTKINNDNKTAGNNAISNVAVKGFFTDGSNFFLAFIMFILPLAVTNGFYNITATKFYTFLYSALLFVGAFIVSGVIKLLIEKTKLNFSRIKNDINVIDVAYGLFIIFLVISAALSKYQNDVWTGKYSRHQGVFTILLYFAIYLIVSRNYSQKQSFCLASIIAFDIVSILSLFTCFGIDLFGFYTHLTENQQGSYIATIGNINFYSSYVCLLLPLTFCGFCQVKEKLSTIIYTASLILGTFGMMVTSSESFVIGFVCAMVVIPVFFFNDKEKLNKFFIGLIIIVASSQIFHLFYKFIGKVSPEHVKVKMSALLAVFLKPYIAALIVVVCLFGCFLVSKMPEKLKLLKKIYIMLVIFAFICCLGVVILINTVFYDKDFGIISEFLKITPDWGTYRGKIWIHCVDKFGEYSLKDKLFGIGPEALYHITGGVFEKRLDQAHNEYLNHLMCEGIFGLLSYLALIGSVIYAFIKKMSDNTLAVGMLAGLVAYWTQAVVNLSQPFSTPIMYIYIACLGGIYYNSLNKKEI